MALISRGRLMFDYLQRLGRKDTYKAKYEALEAAVDNAPTIDAVPVVRCKNCENWDRSWECSSGNPGEHFCPIIGLVTDHDFYCKHGAKMDGDPHDSC